MIFDGHTDIWTDVTLRRSAGEKNVFKTYHLPKWQRGKIKGGIFVLWIDPPYDKEPKQRIRQMLRCMEEELAESSDVLIPITQKEQFLKEDGKIHMVLGMEGLSHVDEESGLDVLDEYHAFGLRHTSMTWNEQNSLATGLQGDPNRGLTLFGKKALDKINELGILMDVSHLNERSFWDVEKMTTKPFIASHSNASSIFAHPRNLTDAQIKAIGNSGGLIGLNAYSDFVAPSNDKKQTVDGLALHGAHIAELIGTEHLALGFDFCEFLDESALSNSPDPQIQQETSCSLKGLANASEALNMIDAFHRIGFSDKEIAMITSENYRRLIHQIWK